MRPKLSFFDPELVRRIVLEARTVLADLGVEVQDAPTRELLADHGATVGDDQRTVRFTQDLLDQALRSAPSGFGLYDIVGDKTHDFQGDAVHFAPASSAIHCLDHRNGTARKPLTADYLAYAKVVGGLPGLEAQSTAMIAADVAEPISDSYRLFLSLLTCEKPVITGAFSVEAFALMHELLVTVRGDAESLMHKPLALFTCCPTSPLKWTDVGVRNLVDCATHGIPVEIIPVPLSGFMAPVTLVGTLIQHTAEVLSGLVIAQIVRPGAPVLFGGCPAIFDIRYETSPMGAVESMMLVCGANEIGHYLGLPTQGYVALSDAKALDAQAGLETSMGATLAALSGVNSISGPGMLDFINCFSLEKLVVDHEICAMTRRMLAGMTPRDDFPAAPLLRELLSEKHLLIADHTRTHLRKEITFPGWVIDRTNHSRWTEEGSPTLAERAASEVKRLIGEHEPSRLPESVAEELEERMTAAAHSAGMSSLPERPR